MKVTLLLMTPKTVIISFFNLGTNISVATWCLPKISDPDANLEQLSI